LAVSVIQATSPLNPILGETITRELDNGAKLYLEQTSHHPPVSHFLMEGPNKDVTIKGYAMYKVGLQSVNTATGARLGKFEVEYKDGAKYSVSDPACEIWGIMNTEKVYNFTGSLVVSDVINNIECEVKYNPNNMKVGMLTKIPGFGNSKAKK